MAVETSPAFQFYVKEWRSSRAVMRMSFAQRGMYLEMLLEQWENVTLPDDPSAMANLIGGTKGEWARAWAILRKNFVSDDTDPTRIVNERLELERGKQRARSGRSSENGKKGADSRWRKNGKAIESPFALIATPPNQNGEAIRENSSSFAIPIAIPIATADAREPARSLNVETDADVMRAGELIQRYEDLFIEHRYGARLVRNPRQDFEEAQKLVTTWADDRRLEKLAILVLTTDEPWISRTDRSFRIFAMKASWADGQLAEWEAEQRFKGATV